jgi:3-polyprenyl-4-hydroxybenzoate decarboxylase
MTRAHEIALSGRALRALADVCHPVNDVGAAIASGSFPTLGMLIAPSSAHTLAKIAHGLQLQPALARGRRHAEGTAGAGLDAPS